MAFQQSVSIEPGTHQRNEEIPLRRLGTQVSTFSRQCSTAQRNKARVLFDKLDSDGNGYLSYRELKRYYSDHPKEFKEAAKSVLEQHDLHDADRDNQLNFEEFLNLYKNNEWLFKDYCVNYCRYLVPQRDATHLLPTSQAADEMDGSYENEMSLCPPPLTMIIFSIIEIIMFLYDIFYLNSVDPEANKHREIGVSTNGPAATLFIYNPRRRFEAWRFVTYMFVHVGVMHIAMNLIIQIFLGIALELVHHWWRVALIYIAGVAAGSMGTSITSPSIYLAGASGGVYALITAHIATIIMNWKEMEYAIVQLFVFVIFITTDVGMSVYRKMTDAHDQVGYMAHLSGAIAGLLVGIGVLRNLNVRPWEKKLWWFAVTLYFALMLTGVFINIFYPAHFPTPAAR